MRDLSKRLRGKDFRKAVQAVAELRRLPPAAGANLIASINTADEQRAFQLMVARLVAEGGARRLAARWRELPSPEWRERLLIEIGQGLHLWVEEGTVELLLAALDDPNDAVARRTLNPLLHCLRERSGKERKAMAKTLSGKISLETADRMAALLTPAHGWRDPPLQVRAARSRQPAVAHFGARRKKAHSTRNAVCPGPLDSHGSPRPQEAGGSHRTHSAPRGLTSMACAIVSLSRRFSWRGERP